ncbi:Ig-like domain-containing protein [Flavobacterium covae]|uniref:Ig-like domain-containing protein n=1 Tax=Flavobacterium covae TaxID=2906076 RepID=UPI000ACD8BEB|nr:Ig-like domain-containing protein [Flavobacterium covae]MCJ1808531.1 Ig-like domain-containing protein [Flavobacterium covae]
MKNKSFILLLFFALTLINCAKRGSITGGDKDITPPKMISSYPKNFSTDFKEKNIRITFDEYIKINDLQKNLIISPTLKNQPNIQPQGGVSRQITIKLNEELVPNTTYSFNFGESIVDNNEGNKLKNFKYVFSTGKNLDSLSIQGIIKDAYERITPNFVNVMLYEVDEKYNDSTIYKQTPRYITNTLDSTTSFKIENIKAGKYKLIALKENVSNYKYDPKKDKIGFYNQVINIPDNSIFELELYKEHPSFKPKRPTQASGNRILLGYEGKNVQNIKIQAQFKGNKIPVRVSKVQDKDSLQIWTPYIKNDSIQLELSKEKYQERYSVKFKEYKKDTLHLDCKTTYLHLKENLALKSSTPIEKWDTNKILLTKGDKTLVPFKAKYEDYTQKFELDFEKEENEKYDLKLLPSAIEDYIGNKNKDTLKFNFSTKKIEDYGNLKIHFKNKKDIPLMIELTNEKGKVFYTKLVSENTIDVDFILINPEKYYVRVIYDLNKNGQWDTGSFLENKQPEEVYHFPTVLDVRANWDVNQEIDLGK